jgi:hypothetical protein
MATPPNPKRKKLLAAEVNKNKKCCALYLFQVPDMSVHTAAAPANPISGVTFTGFDFDPQEKFYAAFQGGVLGKLAVRVRA